MSSKEAQRAIERVDRDLQGVMDALAVGRIEEARSRAEKALAGAPDHPDALSLVGAFCREAGDLERARSLHENAVEIEPEEAVYRDELGRTLLVAGEVDAAIEQLGRAVEIDRADAEYQLHLGEALRVAGRPMDAIRALRRATRIEPRFAAAWRQLALAQLEAGDGASATRGLAMAVELVPEHVAVRLEYAEMLAELGRREEAVQQLEWSVDLEPTNADAHARLGALRLGLGHLRRAETALRRALELDPERAGAWADLGTCLLLKGHVDGPAEAFSRALRLARGDVRILVRVGRSLVEMDQLDIAERALELARKITPANAAAALGLAHIAERRGNLDRVGELIRPLMEMDEPLPDVVLVWARHGRQTGRHEEVLPAIDRALVRETTRRGRSVLHHVRGEILDDLGRHEEAFHAFRQANELRRGHFDPAAFTALVDAMIERFDVGAFERRETSTRTTDRPILVTGLPRSGTSLAEQVLASHPEVHGAGELDIIHLMAEAIAGGSTSPARLASWLDGARAADLDTLADRYLERLQRDVGIAPRITDKMPHNVLYLGFVAQILPGARVVLCRRDLLDTCLSCYMQHFRQETLCWSNRLDWLGHYARETARLMDHWLRVLPLPVFELHYESMVERPEQTMRDLIHAVGLPWDERCLEFHRSTRQVKTASYAQVRRPIYRASVRRSAAYLPWLKELQDALDGSSDEPGP